MLGLRPRTESRCDERLESRTSGALWRPATFGGQYFGIEIDNIEFVMIVPLLSETKVRESIWSLNDLDQLTEIPGSAKQALEIQRRQREMLGLWFGKSLAKGEEQQSRQITSIITRLALDEMDRAKPPRFETL